MKKLILTLLSILPLSNISAAASMRLVEMSNNEKIAIIEEVIQNFPNENFEQIESEDNLNTAIVKLSKNGFLRKNIMSKKSSGAESVGGR